MPSRGTVKLSDLMMAMRFLGVREADDPSAIMSIHIDRLTVTVNTPSLDENGNRFIASPQDPAIDTVHYRIENDL